MTHRTLALVGLFAGAAIPTAAETIDHVRKSFTVQPGGRLVVDVGTGSLDVTTAPGQQLSVAVEMRVSAGSKEREKELLREHAVTFDQTGNDVAVRSPRRRSSTVSLWDLFWNRGEQIRARFTISVPERFDAELGTSGGSTEVTGLTGRLTAKTSGGRLQFTDVTGTIDGKTSGGGIRAAGCEGTATLRTSGGGIDVASHHGDVTAETSGGRITLDGIDGNVVARTSGGSIRADWRNPPTAACRLETSGGGVSVSLPGKTAFDLDASTSGGGVRSDFAVEGGTSRNRVEGRINGGGPRLVLRTSGGSIRVMRAGTAVSHN